MRTVRGLDEFDAALEAARREARAAFGDDAVFLERLIDRPRHVEIQILADAHGSCVHLFERECSIQRRHQKIIEESPSVALTPELRAEMGAAAVRLAQAAGYRNAGTIEFMLDEHGAFYFLEMNTRLQVEHPVTELVAGVDLVRLQIAVAAGERLPFRQEHLAQRGHAIEARVYAEDPKTYLPSTGRVALFAPPDGPGIRNDAGLASGDEVTVHYDPMLAKLIVWAPDRPAAIGRLRRALDEYAVLGPTTNLPLLRAIAAHPDFAAGATRTDFLAASGLADADFGAGEMPAEVLAAAAIFDHHPPAAADPWRAGPWRLIADGIPLHYTANGAEYVVSLAETRDGWRAGVGGEIHDVTLIARQVNLLTLAFGDEPKPSSVVGGRWSVERFHIARDGTERLIAWRGASYRLTRAGALSVDELGARVAGPHSQASLEAPMPGTVIKVLAEEGQAVAAQQPLVVLEAMKMEHVVAAPYDGVVRKLRCAPGALVAKGATLVELEEKI
jgi:3-methylcrotonyl-CoA carboxylase alpha subunit